MIERTISEINTILEDGNCSPESYFLLEEIQRRLIAFTNAQVIECKPLTID